MPRKTPDTPTGEKPVTLDQLSHETMLPPTQAAALLGLKVDHLEAGRLRNTLPLPYHKFGKLVRYRVADLLAFRDSHRVTPGGGK